MTVIAWDGKTLAADKQSTHCGMKFATTKLTRFADGSVGAAAGPASACAMMCKWYADGADLSKYPDCQKNDDSCAVLVVAKPGGTVDVYDNIPIAVRREGFPAAWGSGQDFAIGAMLAGASARRAVEITCMTHTNCGFGVDSAEPVAPGSTIATESRHDYLNGSSIDCIAST